MAHYISKEVGEEITANGTKRKVTKLFLADEKGSILHDKPREDDPEGVNRRIEVEAHKNALRKGIVLRKPDEKGKMKYEKLFWEEFPGTMDQAEEEMKDEEKHKAEIEKRFRAEMEAKKPKK